MLHRHPKFRIADSVVSQIVRRQLQQLHKEYTLACPSCQIFSGKWRFSSESPRHVIIPVVTKICEGGTNPNIDKDVRSQNHVGLMRIKTCRRHGEALCAGVLFQATVFWCVFRWVEMANAFGSSCSFTCNLHDLGFVYGRNARNGAPSIFDQEVLGYIGPYQLERPQPGGCLTCGGGLGSSHGSKWWGFQKRFRWWCLWKFWSLKFWRSQNLKQESQTDYSSGRLYDSISPFLLHVGVRNTATWPRHWFFEAPVMDGTYRISQNAELNSLHRGISLIHFQSCNIFSS